MTYQPYLLTDACKILAGDFVGVWRVERKTNMEYVGSGFEYDEYMVPKVTGQGGFRNSFHPRARSWAGVGKE